MVDNIDYPDPVSTVASHKPATIQEAIRLAHKLTDQAVKQGKLSKHGELTPNSDNKRKWNDNDSNQSPSSYQSQRRQNDNRKFNSSLSRQKQGSYAGNYPKCNKCNYHHNGPCGGIRCRKCDRMGHFAKDCRVVMPAKLAQEQGTSSKHQGSVRGCFECGAREHCKRNCPKLKKKDRDEDDGNGNKGTGAGETILMIGSRNDKRF